MEKKTKKQFEQEYAERSGVTVERLKELGREAKPCHCDYELCEGWQMVNAKEFDSDPLEQMKERARQRLAGSL